MSISKTGLEMDKKGNKPEKLSDSMTHKRKRKQRLISSMSNFNLSSPDSMTPKRKRKQRLISSMSNFNLSSPDSMTPKRKRKQRLCPRIEVHNIAHFRFNDSQKEEKTATYPWAVILLSRF